MSDIASPTKIASLRALLEQDLPNRELVHFMLANEHMKAGEHGEALEQVDLYLSMKEDEGSAWRLRASALLALGRDEEARDAYRQGVRQAQKFHHSSMVGEFEQALEDLG